MRATLCNVSKAEGAQERCFREDEELPRSRNERAAPSPRKGCLASQSRKAVGGKVGLSGSPRGWAPTCLFAPKSSCLESNVLQHHAAPSSYRPLRADDSAHLVEMISIPTAALVSRNPQHCFNADRAELAKSIPVGTEDGDETCRGIPRSPGVRSWCGDALSDRCHRNSRVVENIWPAEPIGDSRD